MNFERKKIAKITFYRFYLRHVSKILKISARRFQVGVHFHPNHSQPDIFQ